MKFLRQFERKSEKFWGHLTSDQRSNIVCNLGEWIKMMMEIENGQNQQENEKHITKHQLKEDKVAEANYEVTEVEENISTNAEYKEIKKLKHKKAAGHL